MKIAIHNKKGMYTQGWINYCIDNKIEYKIVNCYNNNIIEDLKDCDALMWHHSHFNPKDILFAKQLMYSLEVIGKKVFPDFRTSWHFDDKLGQKYLLESIGAPLIPTHIFYSYEDALGWIRKTEYPKVFKLRCGSASMNIKLVKSARHAKRLAKRSFGRGFRSYGSGFMLKDRWIKYKQGKEPLVGVLKGVVRMAILPKFCSVKGREVGYIYFQDFIPDNENDIRLFFVNQRCFGKRRLVRPGDFRASGSDTYIHEPSSIPKEAIEIVFRVANKLKLQSAAFDFVMDKGKPLITEICYASGPAPEYFDHGYWDKNIKYYPGSFNPFGWMVEDLLDKTK